MSMLMEDAVRRLKMENLKDGESYMVQVRIASWNENPRFELYRANHNPSHHEGNSWEEAFAKMEEADRKTPRDIWDVW